MTQATVNTTQASPVQKREEPVGSSGAGAQSALRGSVRGMSFAEGEAALAPIQMKGGPGGGTETTPTTPTSPGGGASPEGGGEHIEQVAQNLGKVDDMPAANSAIGRVIDAMTLVPGNGFKGELEVEVPVGTACFMALKLEGGAKQTLHGKREVDFKARLTFGVGVDLHFVELKAGVFGEVGIKAAGDSGSQCMQLMGLLIQQKVAAVSTRAANAIFGRDYAEGVLKGMDEGDEVEGEGGVGVTFSGGAGGGHGGAEAGLDVGIKSKTKLSKGEDGKLKSETETGLAVTFGMTGALGPFEGEGKVEAFFPKGKGPSVTAEVELMSHEHEFAGISALAGALAACYAPLIAAIVNGVKGKDHEAEMRAQQLAGNVMFEPIAGFMVASGLAHAGIGIVLEWEDGAFKKYEVEVIKEVGFDAHWIKGKGKQTTTIAEQEFGEAEGEEGGGHGGGH